MHFPWQAAGQAVQIGAALADGAGLRGQYIRLHPLLPKQIPDLIGDFFVCWPGGQTGLGVRNVGD